MRTPAFYLVIDLEATCDADEKLPRGESEIIEIGAVLVDAITLDLVEEFQTFVRPGRHPILTPFCTTLTSITQADVADAPSFPEAVHALGAFIGGRDILFCSWGDYDRKQLDRDARRHGRLRLPLGKDHANLKDEFARRTGDKKKLGMVDAMRRVGLIPQGTAHRGIDDARNIARLLPYILGRERIPPTRARTDAEIRREVDAFSTLMADPEAHEEDKRMARLMALNRSKKGAEW